MNSFKTFINKVGERVRDVTPQGASIIDGTDPGNEGMEGFVCPTCFLRFSSPEQLEKHYSDEHLDPSANYLCPVCKARLNTQSELEVHYTANHSEKNFNNHSIEALKEELMELSTNLREERWYSEELQKEVERLQEAFKKKGDDEDSTVYVHQSQLEAIEESKKLLSSEVVLLRKQMAESLEQMSALRGERDTLEQRASDFAVERAELRATLDSLQADKVVLDTEFKSLSSNLCQVECTAKEDVQSLRDEILRSASAVEEKTKEVASVRETEAALHQDLKTKSESTAALKEELRDLKFEIDLMKKKLQDKCDETASLGARLKENEALVEALKLNQKEEDEADESRVQQGETKADLQSRDSEMDARASRLRDEIEVLTRRLHEAESSTTHAQQLLKDKMKVVDDTEDKVAALALTLNQKENKINELETCVSLKETSIEELQKMNEDLAALTQTFDDVCREKKCLEGELHSNIATLSHHEKLKTQVENELLAAKENLSTAISSLEKLKLELSTSLETISERDTAIVELEYKVKEVSCVKETLSEKLRITADENESRKKTIELLQTDKRSVEKEAEILSGRLEVMSNQLQSSITECKVLHKEGITYRKEITKAEEAHDEMCCRLTNEITTLEKKGEALERDKHDLQVAVNNVTEEKLAVERRNIEAEQQTEQLSQDIQVKEETEMKLNETLVEFGKEVSEYKTKSNNLSQQISSLQNQISSLEEYSRIEEAKLSELEGRLGAQEAEMAGLAGDKLELEVKVEAASEEQKGLVERCVRAESEVERVQQQLTQSRRKLDEATAALHELGRENQSLQMEMTKLSGRKWAEDSEVASCSRCEKSFSMTVRRHHCRNCYQIFCNDCSSKQTSLEHNKRPVRVCDSCHAEIATKVRKE